MNTPTDDTRAQGPKRHIGRSYRLHWIVLLTAVAAVAVVACRVLGGATPLLPATPERSLGKPQRGWQAREGEQSSQLGQRVVRAGQYEAELVTLRLTNAPRRAVQVSVELRTRDGKPIPGDVTFDTIVTDNRLVEYNVPSAYQKYALSGKEITGEGSAAHRVRQELTIGPLGDRVRWLGIKAVVYSQKQSALQTGELDLTPIEVLDFGQHPAPTLLTTGPGRYIRIAKHQVPIYPKAQDVRSETGDQGGTLSYVVCGLPYPSDDVAEFYDQWAEGEGWMPSAEATRNWQSFIDSTERDEPLVYQLWLEWVQKRRGERLIVICEYRLPKGERGGYDGEPPARQLVHVAIEAGTSIHQHDQR